MSDQNCQFDPTSSSEEWWHTNDDAETVRLPDGLNSSSFNCNLPASTEGVCNHHEERRGKSLSKVRSGIQQKYIDFDAFFENTMFHEVGHAMGIKETVNDKGPVRKALKEAYSPIEEGKADIMGLFIVTKLYEEGELTSGELMDNYVTFFASIFRSSRFGAASAHGKANMMRFNYFMENGAFTRNDNGTYTVNFEKMHEVMVNLLKKILYIQGNGNYEEAVQWVENKGLIIPQLQEDLDRLKESDIPVDVTFNQGLENLNL